jgi:hypothetical protein
MGRGREWREAAEDRQLKAEHQEGRRKEMYISF